MSQSNTPALAQLELLQKRADGLNNRRHRVQAQLEAARQQYTEAVTDAVAKHETSNLAELRAKLVRLEADNAQAIVDFTQALDGFEKYVASMEEALADPEKMAALILAMEKTAGILPTASAAATTAPAAAPTLSPEDI